jgi:putative peptidoglycan lipid II flippase
MSHVFRSTLLIAVFFGLEKGLGFVRQVLIARQFGLSPELDAFNAANNLPDLVFVLISGGALGMALIPLLTEQLAEGGRPAAWDLFSRVANLLFLATALLSAGVALLAQPLINWELGIAPGFGPAQRLLVAELMRLNLIATLLFSLSGLVAAGLQANQHFMLPALAPSMYDLGTLFGVLILAPEQGYQIGGLRLPAFGLGIYGLVYGTILGAALFLGIQLPGLLRYQFRWTASLRLADVRLLRTLVMLVPRLLTVACVQLIFLVQDNLASRLAAGAVTALVYGWLFMQVPETLIGTALGTALLPTLSEQRVRGEEETFRSTLNQAVRVLLALTLPAAAVLAVVIGPVVRLLGFDANGTARVVWTARAFLLGLAGHSLLEIAVRAFYARRNAWVPLLTAALTVYGFVWLALVLFRPLDAPGLALANTLAVTIQALALLGLLDGQFPGILAVAGTLGRALLASGLGALAAYLVLAWAPLPSGSLLWELVSAGLALAAGGLVVLPFIWTRELRLLVRL